jgi:hypothetical protein
MEVAKTRRVFISCSRSDRPIAGRLIDELTTRGIDVKSDEDFPVSDSWRATIYGLLKNADGVIFLVGPKSEGSDWQHLEWSAALEAKWEDPKKRLIPVLLDDTPAPPFLVDYQALRLKRSEKDYTSAVDKLIDLLQTGSGQTKSTASVESAAKRDERLQYIEKAAETFKPR